MRDIRRQEMATFSETPGERVHRVAQTLREVRRGGPWKPDTNNPGERLVLVHCKVCGTPYRVRASDIGRRKTCSAECRHEAMRDGASRGGMARAMMH